MFGLNRFGAKGQSSDDAQALQQLNAAGRKVLCAANREYSRQFQHQIHAGHHGGPGALPFVKNRDFPALRDMTAHDGDHGIGAAAFSGLRRVIGMSIVKRIVFGDNASCMHCQSVPFII